MSALEVRRPATIFDMAEYGGARSALNWAILKEMHQGGETCVISLDGVPLGLFGVYPAEEGLGEAWFNIRPDARKHMLSLVRLLRLTLLGLDYREIVTFCGTPEGARVAKAIGFRPSGTCEIGEIWTWSMR